MALRISTLAICVAVLAGAAALIRLLQPVAPGGPTAQAPLATPPGVTLSPGRPAHYGAPAPIFFADDRGMTLYLRSAGDAGCENDCAKAWLPAVAPAGARPLGDWSIVSGPDGARQYAFKGQILYRFSGDAAPGDTKGDGSDGVWRAAQFDPAAGLKMPYGVTVRDQPNAAGQAFHDDRGRTLYLRAGTPCAEPGCDARWKPAAAPEIANAVGDFSAIHRKDGIVQWAYRGAPLFRFDGDREPDDAKGRASGFDVALLIRYFMPAEAAIHPVAGLGDILTDRGGMTLYARDRFIDADGHNFRTDHGNPATGRALGVAACDGDCLRSWRPLAAPADAIGSGYWEVYVRADNTRQWAYKGYALYSYSGDARPGEANGNGIYALTPLGNDNAGFAPVAMPVGGGAPSPGAGIGALFWRAATP